MKKKLIIYRKKIKKSNKIYAYFFIPKTHQEDFSSLSSFTLDCCDGTKYYNLKINKSGDYKNLRFFIYANDFFNDHKKLTNKDVDTKEGITYQINGNIVKIDIPKDYYLNHPSKQTISPKTSPIDKNDITGEKAQKDVELKQIEYDEAFKDSIIKLIGESDSHGLRKIFKENEWCFRASEENVRVELIDPVLKVLGWSIPYLRREDHNRDYVLCREKYAGKRSTQIIIEAKKFKEQLLKDDEDEGDSNTKKNEQLSDYLDRAEIHYGILTNGIRWCLFNKKKYLGEINIKEIADDGDVIFKFFKLISFDFIKNNEICNYELNFLHKENRDYKPSIIVIDSKPSPSQCDACYQIARMGLEKKPQELFDIEFFRDIVFRKTDEDYYIKASRLSIPYEKDDSKFLIGDYGIYDKITLLQEINSTLDLGLSISAK